MSPSVTSAGLNLVPRTCSMRIMGMEIFKINFESQESIFTRFQGKRRKNINKIQRQWRLKCRLSSLKNSIIANIYGGQKKRKKWYWKMLRWFVDVLNLNVSFETIDNFNSGNGGKIIKFSGGERNKNCEFIDNDLEKRQREHVKRENWVKKKKRIETVRGNRSKWQVSFGGSNFFSSFP